jgi:hypothetical protein
MSGASRCHKVGGKTQPQPELIAVRRRQESRIIEMKGVEDAGVKDRDKGLKRHSAAGGPRRPRPNASIAPCWASI